MKQIYRYQDLMFVLSVLYRQHDLWLLSTFMRTISVVALVASSWEIQLHPYMQLALHESLRQNSCPHNKVLYHRIFPNISPDSLWKRGDFPWFYFVSQISLCRTLANLYSAWLHFDCKFHLYISDFLTLIVNLPHLSIQPVQQTQQPCTTMLHCASL